MPMNIVDSKIEDYACRHSDPEPPLLKELREETYATMDLPQMLSGHLQGRFLKHMAALTQAGRILEIGMFTGYSTLCFAEGMAPGAIITTCDVNPKAIAMARKYFNRSLYAKQITIKEGPALETIKRLQPEPPLDLVFIDADKQNYLNYYQAVLPMVRPNGVILVDNVLWSGQVLDPKEESDKAIAAFNKFVASDERVSKVLVTLRDGLYVLRKK